MTKIFRYEESSYETLLKYLNAMKISNLSTETAHYFKPYAYDIVQFRRVFQVFGPSIKYFQYCRPLISIYYIHVYEKYRGCLLVASGVNAGVWCIVSIDLCNYKRRNRNILAIVHIMYLLFNPQCASDQENYFLSLIRKGIPNALRASWPSPQVIVTI